jgi:hypothetical protein
MAQADLVIFRLDAMHMRCGACVRQQLRLPTCTPMLACMHGNTRKPHHLHATPLTIIFRRSDRFAVAVGGTPALTS